jgi:DNA-binding transcriptional ArsR family regulator
VPTGIGAVAIALSHPLRVKILAAMNSPERRRSATDLAEELKIDVKRLSYHFRELATLGFIEQVDERPVRGSLEKIFAPAEDPPAWDLELAKLPKAVRAAVSANTLGIGARALGAAIDSGEFTTRDDSVVSQKTFWTDDQGAVEALAILAKAIDDLATVEAEAKARLLRSDEQGFAISHLVGGYEGGVRPTE